MYRFNLCLNWLLTWCFASHFMAFVNSEIRCQDPSHLCFVTHRAYVKPEMMAAFPQKSAHSLNNRLPPLKSFHSHAKETCDNTAIDLLQRGN